MKQKGHVWAAGFAVLLCMAFSALTSAGSPSWWITRGVLNTNWPANDYAPVLAGQLKWMATNAAAELETLPGGAGTGVHALVSGFTPSNNYVPINVGQLKNTAAPFYQRLMGVGYTTNYPWTETTADDADFAPAVLGQLKHVFEFDVSTDSDGDDLPDWWEVYWFGSTTNWTGNGDADVDELSNLLEYQSMTSPTNSDTDADGMPDGWEFGYSLDPLSDDSADDPDEDGLSNLGEYNAGTDPLNGGDPGFLKPVSFRVTTSSPRLYTRTRLASQTEVYGHLNDMTLCTQEEAEEGRESCDHTYEQDSFHASDSETYTTFFRGGSDNVRLILDSWNDDGGSCASYSGSLKLYRGVIVSWANYAGISDTGTHLSVTWVSSNEISWSVYLDGDQCGGGSGGCYPLQVNWRRPTNDLSMTPWIDILPTNHIFMCAGCSNPVTLTAQPYGVTSANYTWSITPSGGAYFLGATTGRSVNVMAGNTEGDYIVQCRPTSNMNLCVLGAATVTVLKVEIEKCDAGFLPKGGSEDNTTTIRAFITPDTVKGKFRFTLYDTSSEPGFCLNAPDAIPASGEDSAAWKDLQFPDQTGFTVAGGNRDVAETTANNLSEATVSVKSFDYGAYGKIKAEFIVDGSGPTCLATEQGGLQQYTKIPLDADGNDIADGWTYNAGGKSDDDDVSLNNTANGDGLTRFEEYRGVDINNDSTVSANERLRPDRKDLFVQGNGFGGGFPAFSYGGAFGEDQIEVHDFVGTVGTDDRNIDVLIVSLLDQGGHIQRVGGPSGGGVRQWQWSTKGQSTVGGAASYGAPEVNKKANDYYFDDKPYRDGNTWSSVAVWANAPNGILDPVNPERVEDVNDNGVLDANENDSTNSPPSDDADGAFDGDYPVVSGGSWSWSEDLSPFDIDADGKVELPRDNEVPVPADDEYTKEQVVRHTITHEMGHACGINGPWASHCNDPTCLMYQFSNNWKRDGHFCNDCRDQLRIHNN